MYMADLRLMVEHQENFKILGEARSAESLLARACQLSLDLILLDWNLPGFIPQRLIPALRECCPSTKLVLFIDSRAEKTAMDYGLDGFLSKELSSESFILSLNTIIEH